MDTGTIVPEARPTPKVFGFLCCGCLLALLQRFLIKVQIYSVVCACAGCAFNCPFVTFAHDAYPSSHISP